MLENSKEEINNLREEINKLRDDFNDYKHNLRWILQDVVNELMETGSAHYALDNINRYLK